MKISCAYTVQLVYQDIFFIFDTIVTSQEAQNMHLENEYEFQDSYFRAVIYG